MSRPLHPVVAAAFVAALASTASAQTGEAAVEGIGLPNVSIRSETGASYVNLSLARSALGVPVASAGLVTGSELDVRVLSFLFGTRLRVHQLADFLAWQLGGLVGMRQSIGTRWQLGLDASFGYVNVARFNSGFAASPSGGFGGATGSADFFINGWLSIGGVSDVVVFVLDNDGRHAAGLSLSLGTRVALNF